MSSSNIKTWLVDQFKERGHQSTEKEWKRRSKSKNLSKEEVRIFEHPTLGIHTIIENSDGNYRFQTNQISSPSTLDGDTYTAPDFSLVDIESSRKLLDEWYQEDSDPEDFIKKNKGQPGYITLPRLFGFNFPIETYGNDDIANPSISEAVGECCIQIFDLSENADIDLYANNLIEEILNPLGLDRMDEYHYEFTLNKDRSIKEWVQKLLDYGLVYVADDANGQSCQPCLFKDELTALKAHCPSKKTSSLNTDETPIEHISQEANSSSRKKSWRI